MALHALKRRDADNPDNPEPCEVITTCPVCGGHMEAVYSRAHQKVCECGDCHTNITIPSSAWDIARVKGKSGKIVKLPSKK